MEIKRAMEFDDEIREKISALYVDAFYENAMKHFSKDKTKLANAFSHAFVLDYFYVALIDDEIAGIVACMGKGPFCMNFDKKILIKHLGFFKGRLAYFGFRQYVKKLPNLGENEALIESVATDKKHQRKGVASALIKHLFALPDYQNYVLEVLEKNVNAFDLYQKLGFGEIKRAKSFGVGYIIMKYSKE
jgi:ribosomal protein S18 acetylase RimI-like enzyme